MAVATALSLMACATKQPVLPGLMQQTTAPVELRDTPFFPQAEYQCGPAALAMILNAAGVAVEPDDIVSQVYLPASRGSLQIELLAASRRAGRIPFRIEPTLDALHAELDAGRPVLVLQNLGLSFLPVWHYAVVVGIDPAGDKVVLRSGVERRRQTSAGKFLRSWGLAANWGMIVLRPGELPARATEQRLIAAVARAEPNLSIEARKRAYRAVLNQRPESIAGQFGYANALHAAGELEAAEACYRRIIRRHPRQAAALNNLAEVLKDRGCYARARAVASRAMAIAADDQPALVEPISETFRSIRASSGDEDQCVGVEEVPRSR